LASRREELQRLRTKVTLTPTDQAGVQRAVVGRGQILVGPLEPALTLAGIERETLVDRPGLQYLRRRVGQDRYYFLANRGHDRIDGWVPLACAAESAALFDPRSGRIGIGEVKERDDRSGARIYLKLEPGETILVQMAGGPLDGPRWEYWQAAEPVVEITGSWRVEFLSGGPELPPATEIAKLASWTEFGGEAAQRFAGTARYTLRFNRPPGPEPGGWLDLGRICQSARVRVNGQDLGTVFTTPCRVRVDSLKEQGNVLEVEVTNVSANRIRDLDRRQVAWRTFHDINFVNMDYKPFDASDWPLTDSGLLGPVRWLPVKPKEVDPL
jgi:hypothetical protein